MGVFMLKRFILACTLLGLTMAVPGWGQDCTVAPSNLLSWWPGDGDANDFTLLGGNNGTLENGATFTSGRVNQAFSFDGIDQYVDAGNRTNLAVAAGDFTVDAWVNFASLTNPDGSPTVVCRNASCDMSIVDKMYGHTWGSGGPPNSDGWRLFKQFWADRFWFCLGGGGSNGCELDFRLAVQSSTIAQPGQWYFVAGVKASNTISIYVNGVLEASTTLQGNFVDTNSTNLLIGGNAVEGAYMYGLIDEVEIFNRALSASEIQSIFNAGSAGKCKFDAHVQPPIAADGTSVFNARRGVVPVKFTVTLNGAPTCQLPPATISVRRLSGGTPGPINNDVFQLPSDDRSNFRIDTRECQYVYNLALGAFGVGTYQAFISINGSPHGSAVFALQ
jgi:hypothetical protein